jgi:hypothetical protein
MRYSVLEGANGEGKNQRHPGSCEAIVTNAFMVSSAEDLLQES